MFESFYTSFWQHPFLLCLFPSLFGILVRPRGSYFERSVGIFLALTILDPLVTGPLTSFLGWNQGVANAVMIFFVLLGDFRLFFFVERFGRSDEMARRSYLIAGGLTLAVPILQAALIKAFPSAFDSPRHTFLAYELLFLVLAAVYRFLVVGRRESTGPIASWLDAVVVYAMIYYGLWAGADALILAGFDFGFLVRVVPNILYYGLFIPFVYWKAPASLKRGGEGVRGEE